MQKVVDVFSTHLRKGRSHRLTAALMQQKAQPAELTIWDAVNRMPIVLIFTERIAEMTLKITQGHLHRHYLICITLRNCRNIKRLSDLLLPCDVFDIIVISSSVHETRDT